MCSVSVSNTWSCFSHSQDPRVQQSRVEMGAAPLTTTPSDSLAKFSLPGPVTLCSAGLEGLAQDLVPKGKMVPPRDTTMILLDWKLRLMPSHFGLLIPVSNKAEKEFLYWLG